MNGVRLGGRTFIACRIAPTVSRSSLAGGLGAIVGLASSAPDGPGRNSGAGSAGGMPGLRTGPAAAGFGGASGGTGAAPSAEARASLSPRFNALSIADMAAETGSFAECCFAMSASFLRRRSGDRPRADALPRPDPRSRGETQLINHVAVYRPASNMKTTQCEHPSNVVNG